MVNIMQCSFLYVAPNKQVEQILLVTSPIDILGERNKRSSYLVLIVMPVLPTNRRPPQHSRGSESVDSANEATAGSVKLGSCEKWEIRQHDRAGNAAAAAVVAVVMIVSFSRTRPVFFALALPSAAATN